MIPDPDFVTARRLAPQSHCRPIALRCSYCTKAIDDCTCGSTPAVSLPSAPVKDETRYKIGDRVFVVADNYGSECTIIAYRDSDPPMASHWQVRTKSGDRFWALDYEIENLG